MSASAVTLGWVERAWESVAEDSNGHPETPATVTHIEFRHARAVLDAPDPTARIQALDTFAFWIWRHAMRVAPATVATDRREPIEHEAWFRERLCDHAATPPALLEECLAVQRFVVLAARVLVRALLATATEVTEAPPTTPEELAAKHPEALDWMRGTAAFRTLFVAADDDENHARAAACAELLECWRMGVHKSATFLILAQIGRPQTKEVIDLAQQHRLVLAEPSVRTAIVARLRGVARPDERAEAEALYAKLSSGLTSVVFLGDLAPLYFTLQDRRVSMAAEDWCNGDRTPEAILRDLDDLSVDLLATLDRHRLLRPARMIVMDDHDRDAALERLRSDRLARSGRPLPRHHFAAREMIATQRLENIDALTCAPIRKE